MNDTKKLHLLLKNTPSISMEDMKKAMGMSQHQIKKIMAILNENNIHISRIGVDLKTGKILLDQRNVMYAILK